MKVKNIHGTSRYPKPPGYSSWLDYWEQSNNKLNSSERYSCPACVKGHYRVEFVGAHVTKANSKDGKWYITPICGACNKLTEPFEVDDRFLTSVPSNS